MKLVLCYPEKGEINIICLTKILKKVSEVHMVIFRFYCEFGNERKLFAAMIFLDKAWKK